MKRRKLKQVFRFFASLTWIAFFRLIFIGVSIAGIMALLGFSIGTLVISALSESKIIYP